MNHFYVIWFWLSYRWGLRSALKHLGTVLNTGEYFRPVYLQSLYFRPHVSSHTLACILQRIIRGDFISWKNLQTQQLIDVINIGLPWTNRGVSLFWATDVVFSHLGDQVTELVPQKETHPQSLGCMSQISLYLFQYSEVSIAWVATLYYRMLVPSKRTEKFSSPLKKAK